ncbi:hypothetical protein VP01_2847g2 [Puccinia sorghi]|uniref:Uncharacterized protein n=1 Tax=Puccinia sorghi TaxID=27349 RepID=A0A0L6V223_9BASI|nr:hypothetical protein VP01_2847g2 [Puccinia sorghi]
MTAGEENKGRKSRDPSATLTKLQEIVHLEESQKTRNTGNSKTTEKPSEDQSDAAAALIVEKGKEEDATSHDADHFWKLHPELRPPLSSKSGASTSNQTPTTQLVEVEDGHESEVSIFLTEAASKPIVLDSGATHHLINNPNVFRPTAETNLKIATGGHSNFLNATAAGTATLINHRGDRLVLENALHKQNGGKRSEDFQLLVINSHSTCYHSSPDNPNWHAWLGHPNQQFQSLMVPMSEIPDYRGKTDWIFSLIACLRRWGEFVNEEFKNLCTSEGIIHHVVEDGSHTCY